VDAPIHQLALVADSVEKSQIQREAVSDYYKNKVAPTMEILSKKLRSRGHDGPDGAHGHAMCCRVKMGANQPYIDIARAVSRESRKSGKVTGPTI
jgi:hypothetical protein